MEWYIGYVDFLVDATEAAKTGTFTWLRFSAAPQAFQPWQSLTMSNVRRPAHPMVVDRSGNQPVDIVGAVG